MGLAISGERTYAAAMDLVAIPQALWFFLPAYVANPMAVVFGGGTPIDFGRTLRDGERLFGDGKTWRGLVGGTLAGGFLRLLLGLPFPAFAPPPPGSFILPPRARRTAVSAS